MFLCKYELFILIAILLFYFDQINIGSVVAGAYSFWRDRTIFFIRLSARFHENSTAFTFNLYNELIYARTKSSHL